MKPLSCLIVDDEARARRTLQALVTEFCEDVEVTGTANSVNAAIASLTQQLVDVILLDVSMPEQTGFALAERPEFADLNIIFITAHNDYAVNAFRVNAVDYLLKPVDVTELRTAFDRVRERLQPSESNSQASLTFFAGDAHQNLPLHQILYLKANGAYTEIVTLTGKKFLVSKALGIIGEGLEAVGFYRTHRSYLVRVQHIRSVSGAKGCTCELVSGEVIPVSRYRRSDLLLCCRA